MQYKGKLGGKMYVHTEYLRMYVYLELGCSQVFMDQKRDVMCSGSFSSGQGEIYQCQIFQIIKCRYFSELQVIYVADGWIGVVLTVRSRWYYTQH